MAKRKRQYEAVAPEATEESSATGRQEPLHSAAVESLPPSPASSSPVDGGDSESVIEKPSAAAIEDSTPKSVERVAAPVLSLVYTKFNYAHLHMNQPAIDLMNDMLGRYAPTSRPEQLHSVTIKGNAVVVQFKDAPGVDVVWPR